MSLLESVRLYSVRIPMTVRFRRVTEREAVIIRGPEGWGEFSPFPDYPPEVTVRWLAAALELACSPLPEPVRDQIPTSLTIPAVDVRHATDLVRESGASTAKVKVADAGESTETYLERVKAVRDALGQSGKLRVDVNAQWEVDEAVERIEQLSQFNLQFVEQPVRTIDELAEVRKRVDVPIAADESVRLASDPMEVVRREAADFLVLKPQALGGVSRALDIADRSGLPVVVSSALETSIGLWAGVALAAALPKLNHACGLDTARLLVGDVVDSPLSPIRGVLGVRRPEPNLDLIMRWEADRETESRLMRRLRQAAELLT